MESDVVRLTKELAEALEKSKRGGLEDIAAFGGLMKEKDEQVNSSKISEQFYYLDYPIERRESKLCSKDGTEFQEKFVDTSRNGQRVGKTTGYNKGI